MLEISVVRDYELVLSKEFKTINDYKKYVVEHAKWMETQQPNHNVMASMEHRFLELCKKDTMVNMYYKIAIGTTSAIMLNSNFVYANELGGVGDKLKDVLNPIIELISGLGYPVAYGMLLTGFIMMIMGKKSKGLEIIKWSCIGYIGLQFVPFILSLLELIGRELRGSL
nr:MAG TPA: TrbC/VIRB2 family [Caudoviricetes sp.]